MYQEAVKKIVHGFRVFPPFKKALFPQPLGPA